MSSVLLHVFAAALMVGSSFSVLAGERTKPVRILIAAAASLRHAFEQELIPRFQERNPGIVVEGTYDASGKLQVQIENGLEADIFVSAAMKQMDELAKKNFMDPASIITLLENHVVLIKPAASKIAAKCFEDVLNAKIIALGDPESVPAGQYAREIFINLGQWEKVKNKASFGTNVTEVLNWVAEGSADLGVVYATDAVTAADKVTVICVAPDGSLKRRVVYPAGRLAASAYPAEADLFLLYLTSDEAGNVFEKFGFAPLEK